MQTGPDPFPHQRMVVHQQQPDFPFGSFVHVLAGSALNERPSGTFTTIPVPWPGLEITSSVPPRNAARSRMFTRPKPLFFFGGFASSRPQPSSLTRSLRDEPSRALYQASRPAPGGLFT